MNLSAATLGVVGVVAVAVVLVVRFERLCLRDLEQTRDDELLRFSRAGWTALILFWIPFGGILYLYIGKAR